MLLTTEYMTSMPPRMLTGDHSVMSAIRQSIQQTAQRLTNRKSSLDTTDANASQ